MLKVYVALLKVALLKELVPLKVKLPLLKAALLVALNPLLKMNAPPFHFASLKVAFSSKVKLPLALLKVVLVAFVVPLKE
ncbi:hypothetical protein ACMAWI_04050 [Helicobacter pylori]